MKYTDYILSERPYHPEGLVALPTVIIAVPVLIGFLAAIGSERNKREH